MLLAGVAARTRSSPPRRRRPVRKRRRRSRPHRRRTAPGRRRAAAGPAFRAGVDLVSLNVTVTDGSGHYVTDLAQEDFSVFEDGVKQDVTFFNRTNLPIALALLLDTSASMDTKLPTAQEAAIGFVRRLRPQDLAEIIDFDSRVIIAAPFTNNAAELEQAIRKTSAGGSTSLYNAVYIALKDLKKIVAKKRRRDPAPGDRRALGRRRHVEPAAVRRGARSGEALGDGDLRDRPAQRRRRPRARASRKPSSSCGSSRRKPAGAPSSRIRCSISPRSTARSPTSCRASTPSATRRAIRAATAPGAASSSASTDVS